MSATAEATDLDIDIDLDAVVPCDARLLGCPRVAEWAGLVGPCDHRSCVSCDLHRRGFDLAIECGRYLLACPVCDVKVTGATWRPL